MALGTATVTKSAGKKASAPLFACVLTFLGDGAYAAGGTEFETYVQAALGDSREVLGVVPLDCGGYDLRYNKANKKLKVYQGDYSESSDGPLIEDTTSDQSGRTYVVLVICA